jgi:putative DNA primase/helicase
MSGDSRAALSLIKTVSETHGGDGDASAMVPAFSDIGNGQRFAQQWHERVRYCWKWEEWVVYTNGRWQLDITGEVYRFAKRTVERIQEERHFNTDKRSAHYQYSQGDGAMTKMLRQARSELPIPCTPDDFDSNPMLLSVKNGTIELDTGQFRESSREDMLMKQAPVEYVPEAKAPRWGEVLRFAMNGDEKMVGYLAQMGGLFLTGDVTDSAFFVTYGGGQNSKGTYVSTLTAMLGFDYSTFLPVGYFLSSKMQDAQLPIEVHEAKGKRLVVVSENEKNAKFNVAKIKLWTGGGDIVTGKGMRENLSQNVPTFKLLLQTNNYPQFNDNSKAFKRRLRVVPFLVEVPDEKVDRKLKDYLREHELSGVLNFALAGLAEWRKSGGLFAPDKVKKASSDLLATQDVLAEFVADCVETTDNANDGVQRPDMHSAYERWCASNHEKPMSSRALIGAMRGVEGFGAREHTVHSWRGWLGVKLKSDSSATETRTTGSKFCQLCAQYANEDGRCERHPRNADDNSEGDGLFE